MASAWRLVKTRHLKAAWDGEGAALHGGRWNSTGVRVVYGSATLSLALLEVLVHLPVDLLPSYSAIPVEFDDALATKLAPAAIPAGFQRDPAPPETRDVGDAWVRAGRSAVLAVPSAIVPMEVNYLFNPVHRDFGRIRIGAAQAFPFDRRLVRRSSR
jgi:RES domain-containing protein